MLEKLINNIGRKITTLALGVGLLVSGGCATYTTMSPSLIRPVEPIEREIERELDEPIDYSKLTWQEAIKYVQTPAQAQDYLDRHFLGDKNDSSGESFKFNHSDRRGNCVDYALSAAALLSDNNYPPLILAMGSPFKQGHMVFLYKTKEGHGSIGFVSIPPLFETVEELIREYNYVTDADHSSFFVANLNATYPDRRWIDGNERIITKFYLNQSLIKMKNK